MEELWDKFIKSGAVIDYLRYKAGGEKGAGNCQGSDTEGKKHRG